MRVKLSWREYLRLQLKYYIQVEPKLHPRILGFKNPFYDAELAEFNKLVTKISKRLENITWEVKSETD